MHKPKMIGYLISMLLTDGYKISHHKMYPKGTRRVFSNFTPRSTKYMPDEAKEIVVFGTQFVFMWIVDHFNENFFSQDKETVLAELKRIFSSYSNTDYDVSHFGELHDLGYLPIEVRALAEGTITKVQVPTLVYYNTIDDFFWIVNFLESLISTLMWKPMHSASMAYGFRKILRAAALDTDKHNVDAIDFQMHDFSFRGMQAPESAISSSMGFSVCSNGSDTLPVLWANEYYYFTSDSVFSVPASEHAVATAYGRENEEDGFRRILEVYDTGFVSLVSDSYDFWKIHTETIYNLKEQILARDGKTIFRGDSGNPADIVCGLAFVEVENVNELFFADAPKVVFCKASQKYYETNAYDDGHKTRFDLKELSEAQIKGQIELLWDCFGGSVNDQGYKILNPKVGAIWGDGIGFKNMIDIIARLKAKGFASTNIVFGIGSYSMGYATRDNQGTACKATWVLVYEEAREIYKDPITDHGKKSAKGLLAVFLDENGEPYLKDQATWEEVFSEENQHKLIFVDGEFVNSTTLIAIRKRLRENESILSTEPN